MTFKNGRSTKRKKRNAYFNENVQELNKINNNNGKKITKSTRKNSDMILTECNKIIQNYFNLSRTSNSTKEHNHSSVVLYEK